MRAFSSTHTLAEPLGTRALTGTIISAVFFPWRQARCTSCCRHSRISGARRLPPARPLNRQGDVSGDGELERPPQVETTSASTIGVCLAAHSTAASCSMHCIHFPSACACAYAAITCFIAKAALVERNDLRNIAHMSAACHRSRR